MTILKSRLHPILPEVEAKLQEVHERILIVCVDGHPLRALGGGVDGVETNSDFAFEVATDCVQCQTEPLAGSLVLGAIVIMTGSFRVRPVGLEGVSTPVDEEMEVIRHQTGGSITAKVPHSLLPEVRWTASFLHIGGETIRVFSYRGRLVMVTN
jgi:hypothetical protein